MSKEDCLDCTHRKTCMYFLIFKALNSYLKEVLNRFTSIEEHDLGTICEDFEEEEKKVDG